MTPETFNTRILAPGLEALFAICGVRVSIIASRFVLAVVLQESRCEARYQRGTVTMPGPARGFAQFERDGAVVGVMTHPATSAKARALCEWYGVEFNKYAIWRALEGHDGLAVGFARLLLLTDPHAIPTTEKAAWDCYLRTWRPGRPKPETWGGYWASASSATTA